MGVRPFSSRRDSPSVSLGVAALGAAPRAQQPAPVQPRCAEVRLSARQRRPRLHQRASDVLGRIQPKEQRTARDGAPRGARGSRELNLRAPDQLPINARSTAEDTVSNRTNGTNDGSSGDDERGGERMRPKRRG